MYLNFFELCGVKTHAATKFKLKNASKRRKENTGNDTKHVDDIIN